MKNVSRIVVCALAALALLAGHRTAQADTVTYSVITPMTPTNFSTTMPAPKFDTSLGKLTSIKITLGGTLQSQVIVQNMDDTSTDVSANISANLVLTRPDNSFISLSAPVQSCGTTLAPFSGNFNTPGPDYYDSGVLSTSQSVDTTLTNSSDLALFQAVGGGTISLPLNASAASSVNASGNVYVACSSAASAALTITYTYVKSGLQISPNGSN